MEQASDIQTAERLVFPGVGAFGQAMNILKKKGLIEPLKEYLKVSALKVRYYSWVIIKNKSFLVFPSQEGKPFLGICLGLQLLFEGSEESGGCEGLGIISGQVMNQIAS